MRRTKMDSSKLYNYWPEFKGKDIFLYRLEEVDPKYIEILDGRGRPVDGE
jgi:hypothetical protein